MNESRHQMYYVAATMYYKCEVANESPAQQRTTPHATCSCASETFLVSDLAMT